MKVLTVKNPWADWIIFGMGYGRGFSHPDIKTTENRTWQTLYRGKIAIHVSKKLDISKVRSWNARQEDLARWGSQAGKIIGVVELYTIDKEFKTGWDEAGLFHWRLRNPQPLKSPVLAQGGLGLWDYAGILE